MPLVVAICTQAMRQCAGGSLFFQRKSEASASDVGKLVFVLFSFPLFEASHLFFKLAYAVNQRRLLRLSGKSGDCG